MTTTVTTTLGFIGLGSMGAGMAARLLEAGHDVLVWNRSKDAIAELVAKGAREAATPAEVLGADISFSMLANDTAVEAVLTDEAIAAAAGRIHVVTASISPALADRLSATFEAAGASYVAAPVLGRPEVAAAGQLNILAAGPPAALDAATPYLEIIGKRVWRLGETPSVANAVKAAVNYNIIHALQAIGESVAMTERLGVDPQLFTELLSSTLFGGVVYTGYGKLIATQTYTPAAFTAELGRKDLDLAEQVAASRGVTLASLPILKHVFEVVLANPDLGPHVDWSAIAEVTRNDLL